LVEANEDLRAELKGLAVLHGQDVDLGFPGIVVPLAGGGGHEQVGDSERLELMGNRFSWSMFMQSTAMSPRKWRWLVSAAAWIGHFRRVALAQGGEVGSGSGLAVGGTMDLIERGGRFFESGRIEPDFLMLVDPSG